jgi:hypothetical protein
MGLKGRERAHAEFAWPRIAERHLQFFDELTSTAGRERAAAG